MPVYVVDKPLGMTSHDVVARARRLLGTRRVGHAGTLDPLASGVLVLLVDEATKLSPFLTDSPKRYLAWVAFGAGTPTLDAEGPIDATGDPSGVTAEAIEAALPPFLELREQVPPQFSAVKREGVRAYQAARRGEQSALPARPAGYRQITLLAFARERDALPERFAFTPAGGETPARGDAAGRWRPDPHGRRFDLPPPLGDFPTALFDLEVRAGTYVRAFARDLGQALGVPAHLAGLVRTRAGKLGLEQAQPLEQLEEAPALTAAAALPYPLVPVTAEQAARLRQGQRLPLTLGGHTIRGRVGLVDERGRLVAVAEAHGERMKLLRVWPA